jgi:hypothetical protein
MPFTTFDVNIFGTFHQNLDPFGSPKTMEFVIHVMQVECNQSIINFNMFIEFYAFPWKSISTAIPGWFLRPNSGTIANMKTNIRPQVIHLDSMTPNDPVILYPSCTTPTSPCPSPPSDMRLCSIVFQVPIDETLPIPTGYDTTYTDMYNAGTTYAKLPVKITIIADGCRYTSSENAEIKINRDYEGGEELFGSSIANPNNYPIGFNEKITIS